MWWHLWNFVMWQIKFNKFLHSNELPQRIFWYLVRQLDWKQSKNGCLKFSKLIFWPKINLIIVKMIFVLGYQTRRTKFSNNISSFFIFIKFYFVKMCPLFVGSQLSCLAKYQKTLCECSFGCKNLLNFTWHTIRFHNCHHTNLHATRINISERCLFHWK